MAVISMLARLLLITLTGQACGMSVSVYRGSLQLQAKTCSVDTEVPWYLFVTFATDIHHGNLPHSRCAADSKGHCQNVERGFLTGVLVWCKPVCARIHNTVQCRTTRISSTTVKRPTTLKLQ